jgi:nucleoside-diphosphate-sugar epimerase
MVGAAGFVGARALQHALQRGEVRALAHRRPLQPAANLQILEGDAADPAALDRLLAPGAVVLNFAYGGDGAGERLAEALGEACARRRVRRLVHASTCSVYGRARGELVDEETPCAPASAYERTKHAVEAILERHAQGRYELVILRPTAIFGAGGKNLESLALRVLHQAWPIRYLRLCAMNRRRMHAVDVECVAAAALFLAAQAMAAPVERFIVSQDEEPGNDYASIEAFFVRRFGAAQYPMPPLSPPVPLMRWALRLAGRSDAEPHRRYSAAKLARRGFATPRPFGAALEQYAAWIERHARP